MSTIPFLLSYTPYVPPTGTSTVNSINDMVVITFNPPTEINYAIGTTQQYNDVITVKNITSNVRLETTIEFNDKMLGIRTDNTTSPYVFIVEPGAQVILPVTLKTAFFDARSSIAPVTAPINFIVKNLSNGSVALKNI
jgi:hypothetical protein